MLFTTSLPGWDSNGVQHNRQPTLENKRRFLNMSRSWLTEFDSSPEPVDCSIDLAHPPETRGASDPADQLKAIFRMLTTTRVLAAAPSDPTGLVRALDQTTIDEAQLVPDLSPGHQEVSR